MNSHNPRPNGHRKLTVSEIIESDTVATVNLAALNHADPGAVVYGNVRTAIIGRALRRHRRSLLDELDGGAGWARSSYGQAFAAHRARTAERNGAK